MTRQVIWTKIIMEEFIKEALLTKEEEYIIRTRAAGWTISKQAMELNMSVDSINKMIAKLKKKYDVIQKYNVLLPPRKRSAKELFMDSN